MEQPRQQLALREVTGGAEDYDDMVVWVLGPMIVGLNGARVQCHSNGKTGHVSIDREKQLAAEAAAVLVKDGMTVGLGTGSTVAVLLPPAPRRRARAPPV